MEYNIAILDLYNIRIEIGFDFIFFPGFVYSYFVLWLKSIDTKKTRDFLPNTNIDSTCTGILHIIS